MTLKKLGKRHDNTWKRTGKDLETTWKKTSKVDLNCFGKNLKKKDLEKDLEKLEKKLGKDLEEDLERLRKGLNLCKNSYQKKTWKDLENYFAK